VECARRALFGSENGERVRGTTFCIASRKVAMLLSIFIITPICASSIGYLRGDFSGRDDSQE